MEYQKARTKRNDKRRSVKAPPFLFALFRRCGAFGIAAAVCPALFLSVPCMGVFRVVRYVAPVTRGAFTSTGRKFRIFSAFLGFGVYLIGRDIFRAFLGRFWRSPFRVPSSHRQHRATPTAESRRAEPTSALSHSRKRVYA